MSDVVVKDTDTKGKGLFATKDFEQKEKIVRIDGEEMKTEHPETFPKDVQDHWFPFRKEGKDRYYVLPKDPWRYLNHSCEPNAGIKNERDIVAMRAITKGEEITIDYAMNNIDDWMMECQCGCSTCRKVISTFDALPKEKKEEYKEFSML